MTNFEKIKSMTVEELIDKDILTCRCCTHFATDCDFNCEDKMKDWLNQEAEE